MQTGLDLTITRDPDALRGARTLRSAVFVDELGALPGPDAGQEGDAFDATCDHILLRDRQRPDRGVIATARLRSGTGWTARQFDVSALTGRGLRVMELGRICVHRAYRGGLAGPVLLAGVLDAIQARGAQAVIGTASFHGADPAPHLPALRALRMASPTPDDWRVTARGERAVEIAGDAPRAAMARVPALIKTYLRAGAWVGEGAVVDRDFGTVDVCLVLDLDRLRLPRAWIGAA